MYSAVVLDEKSHLKLQNLADDISVNGVRVPILVRDSGWQIYCHHMTLKLGELPEGLKNLLFDPETNSKIPEEDRKKIEMEIDSYGYTNKAVAVRVGICEILPQRKTNYMGKTAHITVAVNKKGGGKPVNSNDITEWIPLDKIITLTGKVDEIQ